MLKENKSKVIVSSIVILLPVLFGLIMWERLPDRMATHWGIDGNADGFGGKPFVVLGLPVMLLAVHILCLSFTLLDQRQKKQSKKALNIVFWIIPVLSVLADGAIYAAALGKTLHFSLLIPVLLGLMFLFIGNYLPKIRQNRTLGIKLSWTLRNEENWNKTHRLGGKLWVLCGLAMLFSLFLPETFMVPVMSCGIIAAIAIPIVYSYFIYKRHQKEGISYAAVPVSEAEKIIGEIAAVIVVLTLIGAVIILTK